MKKRILAFALAGCLCFNSMIGIAPVYAYAKEMSEVSGKSDAVQSEIIYVADGEGEAGLGDGTKKSPFQNLQTALNTIEDGQTLMLLGNVKYTKYRTHTDGSALPLLIDKAITVEGDYETSSLIIRSGIQLGADVTFRNFRLQMVPETNLDVQTKENESRLLGDKVDRSTSIYLAGYGLSMDHMNTKVGENPEQASDRPFISGGRYKGVGKLSNKASFTVLNPTNETKIAAIYCGDYWYDTAMDVELNLQGTLLDTTIYTGGYEKRLTGDVTVNICGTNNLTDFDQENHSGKVNVCLKKNVFTTTLNVAGVDELILEEGAKIIAPHGGRFEAGKVTLYQKSILNLQLVDGNPVVKGDFQGTESNTPAASCGVVILDNNHTLMVGGEVSGLTNINSNVQEYMPVFQNGHVYVQAKNTSSGTFTVEGSQYQIFTINKEEKNGSAFWSVVRKQVEDGDAFQYLQMIGGPSKIVNPVVYTEALYPVEFVRKNGSTYKPDKFELLNEFDVEIERADGEMIDLDWDLFLDWDENTIGADVEEPHQLVLEFYRPENLYGELILKVTHNKTGVYTEKRVWVLKEDVKPSETPTPSPTVKPSEAPTPSPTVKPSEAPVPSVKPSVSPAISLNKTSVTLYATGTSSVTKSKLTAKVTGTGKTVKYRSSNSTVATVDANGTIVAKRAGSATITAYIDNVKANCKVTVKPTSLTINKSKATIYTAGTTSLSLKASTVGASKKVSYKSSNTRVARVDQYGKVTAVNAGTATITVSANGLTKSCKITVAKPKLTVSKTTVKVKKGKTVKLGAKATPAKTISYVSSNKRYVTVDRNGVVKGVRVGSAVITVKCNGITKRVTVKVTK